MKAVVVAKLVEWTLLTPEIRGSNPVTGKFIDSIEAKNLIEKTQVKKRAREWHI